MSVLSKAGYYLRSIQYYTLLLSVGFLATFIALVATACGRRFDTDYYVARTFYYIAGPLMGWSFDVEGEEHLTHLEKEGKSAVLLGNHQNVVDILYLGRIFPKHAAIMAKKELKWVPGLGWFMSLSGSVFIDRGNNKSAIQSMKLAGDEMKRKKKGAFYLAIQSGTPIVPVVCENYSRLLKKGSYFKTGTLKIKVLPPIETKGLKVPDDVPALIEKVRGQMSATLKEISQPAPKTSKKETPKRSSSPTPLLKESKHKSYQSTDKTDVAVDAVPKDAEEKDSKLAVALIEKRMISDFFHPNVGGVEGHIYSLSVELLRRGRKRVGVRYLAPGLKVYHVPFVTLASSASLPNYLMFLPWFRTIILREKINLVHGHGSLSSLAHEAIHHGGLLGVRSVFSDHSLFSFDDSVGILTNKLLASALRNVYACICVSHTGRENTSLRGEVEPERISVIPNALVASQFQPTAPYIPSAGDNSITIVVISRLVYRKGIDLLVSAAPRICAAYPNVRFLIGGDGPKMLDLLQMRENNQLQDRVELLGSVRPRDVNDTLRRGQIYLNTSLTEAFGISIIEAACSGLFVVSTRVGGVPEILPGDMVEFARADEDDIIRALTRAIETIQSGSHDPALAHQRMEDMYSWASVAERTEQVYRRVMAQPVWTPYERLSRLFSLGPVFGPILCAITAVQWWWYLLVCAVVPESEIEVVEDDWDAGRFAQQRPADAPSKSHSQDAAEPATAAYPV
ncbi:transferase [Trichosporon asahii var. asahii CBS 2479]|uniref:Transferase n=1 Tax=Trichosporon asahii var. asahii (strain ATCC 90039 / CBS 2479 / JCM 2466 / KCTC 7840 / NBRC 103889/ NCYC 2677 / UAMH 7654) TaxID=1186058 RepID=J4UCV5_TRIAS|nr:transferase [Trichosporon asahii var. asahii CBS 2479]EJT48875.1 transferase [Trichosporon asahii var. asahii CBS 2479]